MKIETLQTDELTIRYFRFGNPEGKPMLMIPGIAIKSVMLSAAFVEKQYQEFAEDYNVYVFDRRENMSEHYSIGNMAEDCIQALDALSIRNAAVYGVSQGGMIALHLAIRRPDLVWKLCLCSTAPYIPPKAAHIIREWGRLAKARDVSGLMLSFGANVYSRSYFEKNQETFLAFGKTVTKDELLRFQVGVESFENFDVREELHRIQAPVLVIGAEQDNIFGADTAQEIAVPTKGELFLYEEDAHAVYDENPAVLHQIRQFLS